MDILVSSNLERLLYCVTKDAGFVADCMAKLSETGRYEIPAAVKETIGADFVGGFCTDACSREEIGFRWRGGYLMDTHTAVASRVLRDYRDRTGDTAPCVIVSTASPYKFAADVLSAVEGKEAVEGLDAFECSEMLERVTGVRVPQQVKALRSLPVRHKAKCEPDTMAEAVMAAFEE
jgi:threonine synthase